MNMHSELRFYEGLRGSGVVASMTYGKSRVIFDFGAPFNPMTQPYDGQVERREKSWVRDALRLGQIPPINGVFAARDLGSDSPIQPYEESDLTTGVVISHLHLDHMSGIGMVHPDIPVYLHRDANKLQTLLDQIGESVGERAFSPVDLYEPFWIGEIRITAYFSDHPCAGAVGYLIEPPDGKFYYSGDVRMHGGNLSKVLEDLEKLGQKNVDVLILEATTFSPSMYERAGKEDLLPSLAIPEGMQTESQMLDRVLAELQQSKQLGIFNIYHRDMDLIRGLIRIGEETGRKIVFEPKTAYVVMHMLGYNPHIYIPDNKEYENLDIHYFHEVLEHTPGVVSQEEICNSPGKYFLQNSYENILELFDLPAKGGQYFHLYGIPLVAGANDYNNMMRVLDWVGAEYASFANLYCFNHAYPNNLLYMAEKIAAKNIIAVHSSEPEKLQTRYSKQVLPNKNDVYHLISGELELKSTAPISGG
jgi:ribonuclease J